MHSLEKQAGRIVLFLNATWDTVQDSMGERYVISLGRRKRYWRRAMQDTSRKQCPGHDPVRDTE